MAPGPEADLVGKAHSGANERVQGSAIEYETHVQETDLPTTVEPPAKLLQPSEVITHHLRVPVGQRTEARLADRLLELAS